MTGASARAERERDALIGHLSGEVMERLGSPTPPEMSKCMRAARLALTLDDHVLALRKLWDDGDQDGFNESAKRYLAQSSELLDLMHGLGGGGGLFDYTALQALTAKHLAISDTVLLRIHEERAA